MVFFYDIGIFMNFQQLKTFCTVLSEKSMTAAAQKLFLTQPAVSQQIRQLEDAVGVNLFVRGVRKIKPTFQGQMLYEYAQRILNLADQAELAIQTMGEGVRGPLRIGTLNSIGLHAIGATFSMFLKSNKQVCLQLKYAQGHQLLDMLEKGNLDLAVLPDASNEYKRDPKDCDKVFLSNTELWLTASAKDQSLPDSIYLRDINLKSLVMITGEYPKFENFVHRELKKQGIIPKTVFESSNIGTLKRVIETGVGWGFLPSHAIRKQIKTNRLKHIPIKDFFYSMKLVCYHSKTRNNDTTSEVFLKVLTGR